MENITLDYLEIIQVVLVWMILNLYCAIFSDFEKFDAKNCHLMAEGLIKKSKKKKRK